MWTNSLSNLPQLSDEALGGLCTLATTSSKQRSKSFAFAVQAYTLRVVASVCTGLRKFHQTVAVGCLNCSSPFHGQKAENTAAAPSHTALHRASVPTTLANIKTVTLSVLSDYQAISHKVN
ncbi:hypothetical protein ISCGN_004477 [Ixodes scapularis]